MKAATSSPASTAAPPAPVDPEIQKKVLGDEKPITCRPADLIPDEFEKLKAEIADKSTNEDDVLSYALFPKVWPDFFEKRKSGAAPAEPAPQAPPAEKAPAAEPDPAAAAAAPAPPAPPGQAYRMAVKVRGSEYDVAVEVLEA